MSSSEEEVLYVVLEESIRTSEQKVSLKQIAGLKCRNEQIEEDLNNLICTEVEECRHKRMIVSILDLVQLIEEKYPDLIIQNMGETSVVIEYVRKETENPILGIAKTLAVGTLVFFGAAFTIMAFNNDVSISDLFAQIYTSFTGKESSGSTLLELSYSLGMAAGILIFFHHFAGKRFGNDPTPIEIEMRNYEEDLNNTFVQNRDRNGDGNGN